MYKFKSMLNFGEIMRFDNEFKSDILFTAGADLPPVSIFLPGIIKKFTSKNSGGFIKLEPRNLVGRKHKIISKTVFDEDLEKLDKTSEYKNYGIVAVCIAIPISVIVAIYLIIKCFFVTIASGNSFLHVLLRTRLDAILIGDCICGTALRFDNPTGKLDINIELLKKIRQSLYQYYSVSFFLRFSGFLKNGSAKYFYIPELTYWDEIKRRLLLSKGYVELRLDYGTGKFSPLTKPLYGFEIAIEEFNTSAICEYNRKKSEEYLNDFIFRRKIYSALADCDVKKDIKLTGTLVEFLRQKPQVKVAVIFLHQISDAAYIFGIDCFIDLNDWLFKSINYLKLCGIEIIIKIHPAYFSKKLTYPIDLIYSKHLEEVFKINFSLMEIDQLHISSFPGVMFAHHQVPAHELSRCFPGYLCITHHGTVATEAAYLGHTTLVSKASLYKDHHKFVCIYSSLDQYLEFIKSWAEGGLIRDDSANDSLFRYIHDRNHHLTMNSKIDLLRKSLGPGLDLDDDLLKYLAGINRESHEYLIINNYLYENI